MAFDFDKIFVLIKMTTFFVLKMYDFILIKLKLSLDPQSLRIIGIKDNSDFLLKQDRSLNSILNYKKKHSVYTGMSMLSGSLAHSHLLNATNFHVKMSRWKLNGKCNIIFENKTQVVTWILRHTRNNKTSTNWLLIAIMTTKPSS